VPRSIIVTLVNGYRQVNIVSVADSIANRNAILK